MRTTLLSMVLAFAAIGCGTGSMTTAASTDQESYAAVDGDDWASRQQAAQDQFNRQQADSQQAAAQAAQQATDQSAQQAGLQQANDAAAQAIAAIPYIPSEKPSGVR